MLVLLEFGADQAIVSAVVAGRVGLRGRLGKQPLPNGLPPNRPLPTIEPSRLGGLQINLRRHRTERLLLGDLTLGQPEGMKSENF